MSEFKQRVTKQERGWRWHLDDADGNEAHTSEIVGDHKTKKEAEKGASEAAIRARFLVTESGEEGGWRFEERDAAGKLIRVSDRFESAAEAGHAANAAAEEQF